MTLFLPTPRLLLLLAGASGLFLLDASAAWLADGLLLVLAVLDATLVSGRRAIRVRREAPSRMARGSSDGIRIEIVNPGGRALRVRVVDDLPASLERSGPDVREVRVAGRSRAAVEYRVRATGRGDAVLGNVHVRVRGPLGLVQRAVVKQEETKVRIQPGVLEMRRMRLLGIRHQLRSAGLRNTRQRGEGRAFESLRQYVMGDDPRAIDWKATARRREVLVRQYAAERSQNVVLVVDAGRRMMEEVGSGERLDHALTAALMLADVAGAHGDRVGLMAFAESVQQFLPPRRQPLVRIADALAMIHPRMVEPNYGLAFAFLARQVRRRSLVVFFTDVIDPDASAALLQESGRAAARHVVLTVALRNPALTVWADAAVQDEEGAYRRAAAEEMLQARALALATVRRKGVFVADASPEEAVTAVVNRYLDVKYRGRI